MTKYLGLLVTLGVFATIGLVAAQNSRPTAQNLAVEAAPPAPAPAAAPPPAPANGAEKRIALVVGNAGYQGAALKTAANDAGLIAQTLQAAGFDVSGARDLDQESLRQAMRDFLGKAQSSGPNTVAVIYLAGYGVQLEGENYFVPVDAKLAQATDVPLEAVRLTDYTRPLAGLKLKASMVVLDAGRANPFVKTGQPLAGGLALVDAEPGMLYAFNAAPGTVAPDGDGPYGAYAQALAEMIREGGLSPKDVFDRVRLRVNEMTKGAEVPWQSANIMAQFQFFERAPDAPPPPVSAQQVQEMRTRPIRDLGAQDAYAAALERDSLQGYLDFVGAYPRDPMAPRVYAIIAARREAITWRRTWMVNTPDAYWSYLRRYPRGPHAWDCRRRLSELAVALEPPPTFQVIAYDVPPPPPEEIVYVDRPVLAFYDPVFAFVPPPPPPVVFLAPPPPFWVALPPPPPPVGLFVLPIPVYQPVPAYVQPPAYIAPPPPNNIIYNNVHNTVIVNNTTNNVTIQTPSGQSRTQPFAAVARAPVGAPPGPGATPAAAAAPATIGPSLPPSVAARANARAATGGPAPGTPGTPGAPSAPGTPGQAAHPLPGQPGAPGNTATANAPPGPHALPVPGVHGQPPAPATAPTAALPGQAAPQIHGPPGAPAVPGQAAHPLPGQPGAPGNTATANAPPGPHALPVPGAHGQPPSPGTPPTAALPGTAAPTLQAHPGTPGSAPPGAIHTLPAPGSSPSAALPPGQGHISPTTAPTPHAPAAITAPTPPAAPQTHAAPPPPVQHAPPPPPAANIAPLHAPSPAPPPPTIAARPPSPPPMRAVAPPPMRAAPPPPPVHAAPPPPPMHAAAPPPPPMHVAAPPPPRPAPPPPPAARPAGKPACGGPGQPKCPH